MIVTLIAKNDASHDLAGKLPPRKNSRTHRVRPDLSLKNTFYRFCLLICFMGCVTQGIAPKDIWQYPAEYSIKQGDD
ncbi:MULTISPECIES: hypothetical protein [unclassified Erwinia]|uniref:hypothetical protein n=1 Tax=unclassified Erwinia TaxID=2622719 RepID=UPI001177FC5E|nr:MULTISPECIES: hypothetical protein [unclassified Erwinia]